MFERYLTQIAFAKLFPDGQRKLMQTTVGIVGVGGTGSHILDLIVRMGFGKVKIVDHDTVEISNLNRQSLYDEYDIGRPKVLAAYEKLIKINREVKIIPINKKVTEENVDEILGDVDIIMDGTDSFGARGLLNRFSIEREKIFIFSAVEGSAGMAKAIIPKKTACLECIGYPTYGDSVPCSVNGLIPNVVEMAAAISVTLAVKSLLDYVEDEIVVFDSWDLSLEKVKTKINPSCKICGHRK